MNGSALKKSGRLLSMGSSSVCKYGHGDDYDDGHYFPNSHSDFMNMFLESCVFVVNSIECPTTKEDFDISKWAMEVTEAILEKAFRPPPKVSFMDRYLNHQSILLETDVDEAGNAPETVKEDLFPGNPDPPHTFSLEGTISAEKKRPPKGWSIWDSTLEKERQLYIVTDSLNKRLMEQYWQQGRNLPVFRDERLKCKMYPMFVRDDVSKQEMHLNFDQEIE